MNKFLPFLALGVFSLNLSAFSIDQESFGKYFEKVSEKLFSETAVINDLKLFYPVMNIYEREEDYLVKIEVAGIDKDKIEVSISDDEVLTISGEKSENLDLNSVKAIKIESFYGEFKRAISLPKDIDSSKIEVNHENGILSITIGKDNSKSGKRIIPIK
jgi:HSP20 family protein